MALFGLAHLGNPNATLYGAAAIGIEAGMLLGAAYVVTRRLWLAVGVHFGWNFMQAGVFGPNLSGRQVGSLLEFRLSGPDLLSGGALGVEGSVFAIAVCLAASPVFLKRAQREGSFIRPFWRATIERRHESHLRSKVPSWWRKLLLTLHLYHTGALVCT